jgi:glycerophosphoryl diester phosphodiesterase
MTGVRTACDLPLAAQVQVIAHRGASACFPEHTLAAYAQAARDGADGIEPDLVMTRDGVLVARHENAIGATTDVAAHAEFAARRTRKTVDGQTSEDWFCEDFTLAELHTLRARERLPVLRGTGHDGQFAIPTLAQIIAQAERDATARGRVLGIVPEIKHGSYFRAMGLAMEDALLAVLAEHAYTRRAPVTIQSFEIGNLRYLRTQLTRQHGNIRLLQLLDAPTRQPWDVIAAGGTLDYAQMTTTSGLREIASYAEAIGPERRAVVPLDASGAFAAPTALVRDAHAAGLEVHVYTFRPENRFLPRGLWLGSDPATINVAGALADMRAALDAGVDALFTDAPALGRMAVDGR